MLAFCLEISDLLLGNEPKTNQPQGRAEITRKRYQLYLFIPCVPCVPRGFKVFLVLNPNEEYSGLFFYPQNHPGNGCANRIVR